MVAPERQPSLAKLQECFRRDTTEFLSALKAHQSNRAKVPSKVGLRVVLCD